MKIAFVELRDPTDPHNWSGIPSRMLENLADQVNLQVVGPVDYGIRTAFLGHKILARLMGERFDEQRTDLALRTYAKRIRRALHGQGAAAVISPGSIAIAKLECQVPIIFWTDACFAAMRDYYADFSTLCARSLKDGETQEREALRRCHLAIYSSDWAAQWARNSYPESADKVRMIPFGANLESSYDEAAIKNSIKIRPIGRCNLLFVGVDWRRKGGPTVLEATRLMNTAGVPAKLTIVGCAPFGSRRPPEYVDVVGYLDRASMQGHARLAQLFSESHFLILPSSAEAYGIVLCEAAAFGVPTVASDTGGIPTIVKHGVTGLLLADNATPAAYASAITALFQNEAAYARTALAAFREYKERLNWRVACASVVRLLEGINL